MRNAFVVIGAIAAAIALSVGAWFGYWHLYRSATGRQAAIVRHNYEAQQTYRDEVERKVADVRAVDVQITRATNPSEQSALTDQRAAMVNQLCTIVHRVDEPFTGSTGEFVQKECV